MTDERDKDQLEQSGGVTPSTETPPVVDDWASAFASLEVEAPIADASDKEGTDADGDTEGVDKATTPAPGDATKPGDASLGDGDAGGPLPAGADDGDSDDLGSVDVEATVTAYTADLKQRAIDETARLFAESKDDQGNLRIRQTNGRLGATINDPDIYRVAEDGSVSFYNPDTGKPFTGENPRAQAKAWVVDYNDELRDTFNRLAEEREVALETEAAPVINLMKFVPTYNSLDPVRQTMFDALIEGHEVEDAEGNHIGYDIDLNQALSQVNNMVERIKGSQTAPPAPSTGPALDMPNTGSGITGQRPEFKSVAEAMEWAQDQQIADGKKK
jgi:hypothetical protein